MYPLHPKCNKWEARPSIYYMGTARNLWEVLNVIVSKCKSYKSICFNKTKKKECVHISCDTDVSIACYLLSKWWLISVLFIWSLARKNIGMIRTLLISIMKSTHFQSFHLLFLIWKALKLTKLQDNFMKLVGRFCNIV